MNKISLYICIIFGLLMASCNESLEDNQSDRTSFNADLYFESYGFQTAKTTTLNSEINYNLSIKNDISSPLSASLVIDSSILNNYNSLYQTDYQLLSSDYYTLASSVELAADVNSIPVYFNIAKIVDEIGLEESSNYVLPVKIMANDENILVSEVGSTALIQISVTKPLLVFTELFQKQSIDDTVANPMLSLKANFDFDNIDLSYITATTSSSAVIDYNIENSTNYWQMPSNSATFQGITVDEETKELSINYSVDLSRLNGDRTYLLPISLTSDVYAFDPGSDFYIELSINATAPVYEGVINLTTNQAPDNNYVSKQLTIDLTEAATLLNTTEAELKNNIVFYAIDKDEITLEQNYTANAPGFWFNTDGNADNYGDNGLLYVEYVPAQDDILNVGYLNVGQYPEAVTAGESYTVSMALVYNGLFVRYNITMNVLNIAATYNLSIDAPVDNNYAAVPLDINIAQAAADLGITADELKAQYSLRAVNATGEIITGYTANNGFWLTNDGNVCNWGADGCSTYIEYDWDTTFNIGQFPSSGTAGNVYNYTILFVHDENSMVQYNITVNII